MSVMRFAMVSAVALVLASASVHAQIVDPQAPLSSVVAVSAAPQGPSLPSQVRTLVDQFAQGALPVGVQFPLANQLQTDVVALSGLQTQVVVRWLDPLHPTDPFVRFGSNCDYLAWFGDGWDANWQGDVVADAPQYNGSGTAGWMWANHEYVSNDLPTATTAPTGQCLTLARALFAAGLITTVPETQGWPETDLTTFDRFHKKNLGGSWLRLTRDGVTGAWQVVLDNGARRYDSTSDTLLTLTGQALGPASPSRDHNDGGRELPNAVVAGIMGDCSGGQTPWGTIITAEENVQDYYGDLEAAWSSNQAFIPGRGFDPGSNICPVLEPSRSGDFGRVPFIQERHSRDIYGYLAEIDPTQAPATPYSSVASSGDGLGHRKIGSMGRARWENACIAVDGDWQLKDGQPIVIYGGDDRRSGRIFKWVSAQPYVAGMTRGQVRALLDDGALYVAHFVGLENSTGKTLAKTGLPPTERDPGFGRWIRLSVSSTDLCPNAAALGVPGTTVGEALRDLNWNGIGGFPNDTAVRQALFTACNKIGIMELNRPEDIEWNPNDMSGTPRLYVAFTNHGRRVALDQSGTLFDPATQAILSPVRNDTTGSIFAMEENNPANPASSTHFTYWAAWLGTLGTGVFDAANPDNVMIDSSGGVWFGTDGNVGRNGTADAVYYLDLDPAHQVGQAIPSYGLAFRVAATPVDAEATGPCLTSDERTLFIAVQHPGENLSGFPNATWPQ